MTHLAPLALGRSVHSCVLCVIAPQFTHAPFLNLVAAGPRVAPRLYLFKSNQYEQTVSVLGVAAVPLPPDGLSSARLHALTQPLVLQGRLGGSVQIPRRGCHP